MKKEELIELGLDATQIVEVFKLNGLALQNLKTKNKEVVNELTIEKETLAKNIEDMNVKLTELPNVEELNTKVQGYEEQIAGYEAEKATWEETSKSEVNKLTYDFLLDNSLKAAGAKSTKLAKAALNSDVIKLVDGKLEGIDTEMERMNKEFGYLFEKPAGDSTHVDTPGAGVNPIIPPFSTNKVDKLNDSQMSSIEKRLAKYQ